MRRKFRAFLALARLGRIARFQCLTHLMLDPPPLPTRRLPPACSLSDRFLDRLCAAFNAAEPPAGQDIWTSLQGASADLRQYLRNGDRAGLRALLSDLHGGTTLRGMAHTAVFLTADAPYGIEYFPIRCRDVLFSLAEALAVRGLMSNQQTPWPDYAATINGPLAPLLAQVEAALGHSLDPTPLGGPPAVEDGGRLINPDFLRHAYAMHRIQEIGISKDAPILEIGGGFGCVARYAYLRGHRDYTIVDLPFTGAIQAAFLADALGEDAVSLHGEPDTAPIKLVPSTAKEKLAPAYDLVLNMDSLPEIGEARDYIRLVREKARLFLSINQEAAKVDPGFRQHFVPQLVAECGGFRRLSRQRYWMEQGYAEELYAVDASA